MEGDVVEGLVVCVSRAEVLQALSEIKTEKAPGSSELSLELIAASGGAVIQVMVEICQRVIDGFEMPVRWVLSMVVPFFIGKGAVENCSCYRAVKILEHGMKLVERLFEKRLHGIVSVVEVQFGLMPERGTIDAVFILRRMQEEYHGK